MPVNEKKVMTADQMHRPMSVFAKESLAHFDVRYEADLHIFRVHGGFPSDPEVTAKWLRSRFDMDEAWIAQQVAVIQAEMECSADVALREYVKDFNTSVFLRDDRGLYLPGRYAKSMLKENANILWPKRRWGPSSKGTRDYWAERVFVLEDRIHLGVREASGVDQRFLPGKVTRTGVSAIRREEYVTDAMVTLTVAWHSGNEISQDDWAQLWVSAEMNGIGAARAMGHGRFVVIRWEPVANPTD